MKSSVTHAFRKRLGRLPKSVQEEATRAYVQWAEDPFYPSLHFKRVSRRQPIYSVRIGIGHRALGLMENKHVFWFWVGTHAEYDELLKRL